MSAITVELPDHLAFRLRPFLDQLPRILELGLRELSAGQLRGFSGASEILEFLAGLPTPEEILNLRPSPVLQARLNALLEKTHGDGLSETEEQEWEHTNSWSTL